MRADEVVSWLGELQTLSRIPKRSITEGSRVEELCRLLRGVGYSNQWLEDFTEGRLRSGSIKRWTNGVEVNDTSEKDELMDELRAFVGEGYTVKDLGDYKTAKKSLGDVPMTFAQCAAYADDLQKLDTDVSELPSFIEELADTGLTAKGILRTNELRKQLDSKGLSIDVEKTILEAANNHGGGPEILKLIADKDALYKITQHIAAQQKLSTELSEKIANQEATYNNLNVLTASYVGYIEVAKTLMKYGFDNNTCNELIKACDKYGSGPSVIGAVNKYKVLKELNSEVEGKKAEAQKWESTVTIHQAEYKTLSVQLAEANQVLGEVAEKYRQNKFLHDVASVVQDAQNTRIPGPVLARMGVAFLTGWITCVDASAEQNKKLISAVKKNVEYTISSLNDILREAK